MKRRFLILWVSAFLAVPLLTIAQRIDQLYRYRCAACHGADFEGGSGGSLADGA